MNSTKKMFKKEILRRDDILCLWSIEEDTTNTDSLNTESTSRSSKKPSMMCNITQLKRSMGEIKGKFPLKFHSEKVWLEREIERALDFVENIIDETHTEKEQNGDYLHKNHKLLMWLTHGEILSGCLYL